MFFVISKTAASFFSAKKKNVRCSFPLSARDILRFQELLRFQSLFVPTERKNWSSASFASELVHLFFKPPNYFQLLWGISGSFRRLD